MPSIRRILVAIKDSESKSLPLISIAARLGKGFEAELILFHAITDRVPGSVYLSNRGRGMHFAGLPVGVVA